MASACCAPLRTSLFAAMEIWIRGNSAIPEAQRPQSARAVSLAVRTAPAPARYVASAPLVARSRTAAASRVHPNSVRARVAPRFRVHSAPNPAFARNVRAARRAWMRRETGASASLRLQQTRACASLHHPQFALAARRAPRRPESRACAAPWPAAMCASASRFRPRNASAGRTASTPVVSWGSAVLCRARMSAAAFPSPHRHQRAFAAESAETRMGVKATAAPPPAAIFARAWPTRWSSTAGIGGVDSQPNRHSEKEAR